MLVVQLELLSDLQLSLEELFERLKTKKGQQIM